MRNYVDYGQQGKFFPCLFIGFVGWPNRWGDGVWKRKDDIIFEPYEFEKDRCPDLVPVTVELPPEIVVTEHQTAGYACHHIQLFGVCFELSAHDSLVGIANGYYESCVSAPPSWEEIEEWCTQIEPLGLKLGGRGYTRMQEGFLPFSGESAFEYADMHAGGLLLPPNGEQVDWRDKFLDWEVLREFLCGAWDTARVWRPWKQDERQQGLSQLLGSLYDAPIGAIVFENCD